VSLAALAHQELDKVRQSWIGSSVDHGLPLTPRLNQARMSEFFQVEGQVVAGGAHLLGQHTSCQTTGASDHQGAHDPKPMLLTESRERGEGLSFFHDCVYISTIVEA
jgi:hypothetical protein